MSARLGAPCELPSPSDFCAFFAAKLPWLETGPNPKRLAAKRRKMIRERTNLCVAAIAAVGPGKLASGEQAFDVRAAARGPCAEPGSSFPCLHSLAPSGREDARYRFASVSQHGFAFGVTAKTETNLR